MSKANIRYFCCGTSDKKRSLARRIKMAKNYARENPDSKRRDIFVTKQNSGLEGIISRLQPNDQVVIICFGSKAAFSSIRAIKSKRCTMKTLIPFPMYIIQETSSGFHLITKDRFNMLLLYLQWACRSKRYWNRLNANVARKHRKGLRVGRKSRLNSRWADWYRNIYDYSRTHSATITAEHFHNVQRGPRYGKHISRSEVFSIKRIFKNNGK